MFPQYNCITTKTSAVERYLGFV